MNRNDLQREIERLEKEWDKIDGKGRDSDQHKIEEQLKKLNEQLARIPEGSCCENEDRSFNGGCRNCDDPSL